MAGDLRRPKSEVPHSAGGAIRLWLLPGTPEESLAGVSESVTPNQASRFLPFPSTPLKELKFLNNFKI